ncbi:hypothetical protein BDV93DRAFT_506895 [Ceratobasidium sp. AG-I]|nr:hypothetical protein BDV93DRAFT_506895 [Ceratobasidium sp. AG-I]
MCKLISFDSKPASVTVPKAFLCAAHKPWLIYHCTSVYASRSLLGTARRTEARLYAYMPRRQPATQGFSRPGKAFTLKFLLVAARDEDVDTGLKTESAPLPGPLARQIESAVQAAASIVGEIKTRGMILIPYDSSILQITTTGKLLHNYHNPFSRELFSSAGNVAQHVHLSTSRQPVTHLPHVAWQLRRICNPVLSVTRSGLTRTSLLGDHAQNVWDRHTTGQTVSAQTLGFRLSKQRRLLGGLPAVSDRRPVVPRHPLRPLVFRKTSVCTCRPECVDEMLYG